MSDTELKNSCDEQNGTEEGPNIPLSGLEYLETIDKLFIKQEVNLVEAIPALEVESKNKYVISNEMGQQVYYAYEDSSFCHRRFCPTSRALTMHIMDMNGQEIIRVNKDLQMLAGIPCCIVGQNCCAFRIEVESPPGRSVGFISQSCSFWRKPKFVVFDADHNDVFSIQGPFQWPCRFFLCGSCLRDETFRIFSTDGTEIGKCAKKWSLKEAVSEADNFSITFPKDLDIKLKATLIGAIFLIDILYFEGSSKKVANDE